MAKKKQEIALMREIESQEEWEDVMGKEGLWVVDVYQEWSGPCDAMTSNFRRMKNELGDDLLHFAMAKSDTIESLEKYRGSCEPCFLYFAAGVLVSFVHGANAPLILRTLTEQLTQEHKVLDGNSERKEVKDPFVANREAADEGHGDDDDEDEDGDIQKFQYNGELVMFGDDLTPAERYQEVEEGYTVAIIKPNVVEDGKVDDILAEMTARGIEVVAQEQRQLTEEEAREFYSHLKDEDYFEDLVSFMTSGPSHVLVLTKGQEDDSIIMDWRDMLGPPTVEDAKENAPESLRARYGQAGLMNALHGSDSKETAARELAFFFPHMQIPTIQKKKKEVQRTLALIRPDAFAMHRDAILERIKEAGFQIALHKEVSLTKEQAAEFYNEHAGQHYFDEIIDRMSSGPLLALGLAREDAVENWRGMLGPITVEEAKTEAPDSLRAQFAVDDIAINQLHGSDSIETAKKELHFFFPVEQTVAMIKPDGIGTKDAIIEKIHEAGFRIAARKETVITRDIAESFYADQKDKDYFNDLVEHMISGPTMFMVLSREGAVEGWREAIGPTDPAQAKEEAPDSLRAQFGTDILKNAVHGCSSVEEAEQKIEALFGPLEFNEDGTVKGEPPQEPEEQAVSGSPVPEVSDVAPEYRQQAEQQQQEEQQQEAAAQEQEAEQEAEAKPQEQEEQQAEQSTEAEGQAEGEGQSEEKPAEAEGGEATEQTQGGVVEEKPAEVEEKPSETPAESAEKDDSPEKTEGEVEEKPAEAAAESAAESAEKEEDAGKDPDVESSHSGIDLEAGQAAQQKATEEQDTTTPSQETKPEDSTPEQQAASGDKPEAETAASGDKPEAETAAAGDKPEAETAAAAEQAEAKPDAKTEEEQKDTPAAEESKDTKAEEEQKDKTEGQKEEEGKGEQKEDTAAETKKEGEEEKKEA